MPDPSDLKAAADELKRVQADQRDSTRHITTYSMLLKSRSDELAEIKKIIHSDEGVMEASQNWLKLLDEQKRFMELCRTRDPTEFKEAQQEYNKINEGYQSFFRALYQDSPYAGQIQTLENAVQSYADKLKELKDSSENNKIKIDELKPLADEHLRQLQAEEKKIESLYASYRNNIEAIMVKEAKAHFPDEIKSQELPQQIKWIQKEIKKAPLNGNEELKRVCELHKILNEFRPKPELKEAHPEKRLESFAKLFQKNEAKLHELAKSSTDQRFLEAAGHIAATLVTGLLYAAGRAIHSKVTRGTVQFWKSDQEVETDKFSQEVKQRSPRAR